MDIKDQNLQENSLSKATLVQQNSGDKNRYPILISIILLLFIVGGGGYYLGIQNAKPIEIKQQTKLVPTTMIATQPTSNPTPTPFPNVTTWKLYNNQAYGFTLQYPPDYRIECADQQDLCQGEKGADQSRAINFYPPKDQDDGYGSISVVKGDIINAKRQQNESLQQYLDRSLGLGTYLRMSTKNIQIDGHEAVQIIEGEKGKERNIRTYILRSDNEVIEIYFTEKKSIGFDYITPIINYPNVNVYFQMLSSLKFK